MIKSNDKSALRRHYHGTCARYERFEKDQVHTAVIYAAVFRSGRLGTILTGEPK